MTYHPMSPGFINGPFKWPDYITNFEQHMSKTHVVEVKSVARQVHVRTPTSGWLVFNYEDIEADIVGCLDRALAWA